MNAADGVISGGWEFVHAAYILTAVVLGAYVISVLSRFSKERAAAERRNRGTEVN